MKPPNPARIYTSATRHGFVDEDFYDWLRDPDWQLVAQTPSKLKQQIRDHLEAENSYTESILKPWVKFRKDLTAELQNRIEKDDETVPFIDGNFAYYQRYSACGDYPIICRHCTNSQTEEILIDGNKEAEGRAYFRIGHSCHSPDHRLIAYTIDLNGSENYELRIRNLQSGQDCEYITHQAHGDFAWAADSKIIFYTGLDECHRPNKVLRHTVGDDPQNDVTVYLEDDPGFFVNISKTHSGQYIIISAYDHALTAEQYFIPAKSAKSEPRLIAPRLTGLNYSVGHEGDRFLILTNADGAEDYKIVQAPVGSPNFNCWQDLIPHQQGRMILHLLIFKNHFVRLEKIDAVPRIVIQALIDGSEYIIKFDEDIYDLKIQSGYEFDTSTLRFAYSSLSTPQQILDFDMNSHDLNLRKEQKIPSGHKIEDYIVQRLDIMGHDDSPIPVSLLRRCNTPTDGTAPLLLYGYGSYGLSIPPAFSPNRLSLVDRGFVYAIAHVRGGADRGQQWYLDGKLENKMNTFHDFISVAEGLVKKGITAPGRIAIQGGSAGGMLIGAVLNMRPDLFGAAVAEVPFVDVLNTMCDETLPLTPPEWVEWGNPILDAKAYQTIRGYSPYDNIGARKYPQILATAGVSDPRVTYWEPAKWIAKLRALKTSDAPVLLYTNLDAGHGGAAGRLQRLEEVSLEYAFIIQALEATDI